MTREPVPGEKPLHWVGSSLKDMTRFPLDVQRSIGFAVSAAQYGGKHPSTKPWKGEGPGVLELVADYRSDAYRAVYTVRFADAVYVLHRFQKKSPKGSKTAHADIRLIAERLRAAKEDYERCYGKRKE